MKSRINFILFLVLAARAAAFNPSSSFMGSRNMERMRPMAAANIPTLTGQPWRLDLSLRIPVNENVLVKRISVQARFEEEPGYEPPQGILVPIQSEDDSVEVGVRTN